MGELKLLLSRRKRESCLLQNKRKHERDDVYRKWNRWHGDLGVFQGFRK